jgi:hypothetical protein
MSVLEDYEAETFTVKRPIDLVRNALKNTDFWVQFLYSYLHVDGKRIKGKNGQVGATYMATHTDGASGGFDIESGEQFRLVKVPTVESSSCDVCEYVFSYQLDHWERIWCELPDNPKIYVSIQAHPTNPERKTVVTIKEFPVTTLKLVWKILLGAFSLGMAPCASHFKTLKARRHRQDSHKEFELYLAVA